MVWSPPITTSRSACSARSSAPASIWRRPRRCRTGWRRCRRRRRLLRTEGEDVLRGVVRAKQPRGLSHMRRAESRARPIAHAAVEGHADDRDVRVIDLVEARQAGEGGDAREARHDARVHRAARASAALPAGVVGVGLHIRQLPSTLEATLGEDDSPSHRRRQDSQEETDARHPSRGRCERDADRREAACREDGAGHVARPGRRDHRAFEGLPEPRRAR